MFTLHLVNVPKGFSKCNFQKSALGRVTMKCGHGKMPSNMGQTPWSML
jgi:hypothetical protein